jgi:hypothetical protein
LRATYIGHATYLFEVASVRVLVDPLVTESFQDGTAIVEPPRRVNVAAIPPVDIIVVTHCHPGHLEPASLDSLPRTAHVFHPSDPTIELVLDALGFEHTAVQPRTAVELRGGGTLCFTPSASKFAELGCLLRDASGTTWYAADTTADQDILRWVAGVAPVVDLLIGNYPAYNHRFFTRSRFDFPIEELIGCASVPVRLRPKLFVPNFTGLRYVGEAAWINRYMFPMTAERFLEDVRRLSPTQESTTLVPGDLVHLADRSVTVERGACAFVTASEPPNDARFDPTDELPKLRDPNPEGLSDDELMARISAFLETELMPWVTTSCATLGTLPNTYAALRTSFRLSVVFASGAEATWLIRMTPERVSLAPDDSTQGASCDLGLRIAASVLDRWYRAEIPYYHAYCFARPFGNVWRVARSFDSSLLGEVIPERDLVSLCLSGDLERVYHPWLRRSLAVGSLP